MLRRRLLILSVVLSGQLLALPVLAQSGGSLASVETNWDGISLDLLSVERKASVLTVKWAVRNTGQGNVDVRFGLVGKQATTYVVDEESGTKYYALTDQEGHLLASESEYVGSDTNGISDIVAAGQTKRYWMKLPAPPPEVKEVTVFFTNTEPFESVAIAEKP